MGESCCQVRHARQGVHSQQRRSSERNQHDDKRLEHRQGVGGHAGKEVVRVEVDRNRQHEDREPGHAGEGASDEPGERGGASAFVQNLAHRQQSAVPDEDVPRRMLAQRVLPRQHVRHEQRAECRESWLTG